VVISTKVAKWVEQPGLSPVNIRQAVDGSLKRLQVDCIDLYQAHEDDASVPMEETLWEFARLIAAGKPASTPVAIVVDASLPTTRVHYTTLGGLAHFEPDDVSGAALLLIGPQFRARVLHESSSRTAPHPPRSRSAAFTRDAARGIDSAFAQAV